MAITCRNIRAPVLALCFCSLCVSYAVAQDDATKQRWAEELVDEIATANWDTTPKDHWAGAVRDLVEIGPPAVVPICEALRETDGNLQMRLYGFALRAIRDPRAAPALIESIPKTLIEPGSDMGVRVTDAELNQFMLDHDLRDKDNDDSFGLARPCREIMGALQVVTGHDMGDRELYGIWLSGSAAQAQMKKELYHRHAERWKDWWEDNARRLEVDMEFHSVELPPFEPATIETGDPFRTDTAVVTYDVVGDSVEPLGFAKYACFRDLDTGREGKLPQDFAGDPSDLDQVIAWAREQRYDLIGLRTEVPGHEGPVCVLRPIAMEVWQNDGERFDRLETEVGEGVLDLGTPVEGYMAWFDSESGTYDLGRTATFLFRTSDGTCGAILYRSQSTWPDDRPQDQRPTAYREGVRFNLKLIHEP